MLPQSQDTTWGMLPWLIHPSSEKLHGFSKKKIDYFLKSLSQTYYNQQQNNIWLNQYIKHTYTLSCFYFDF